jgi:hypothetical protein
MVVKKEQGLKSYPAEAGGFNQKRDYKAWFKDKS